jgi:hypothetical protein
LRPGVIGEDDDCIDKALIDVVIAFMPEARSKIKKNEDAIG